MRTRLRLRTVALAALLAFTAAACSNSSDQRPPEQVRGGKAVFGAQHWPQCLNPVTTCNFATGFHLTVAGHVLPKLMMLDDRNDYVASPLLARAPSLENGLITANPFKVTYKLNPEAVWDDGSAITSRDIKFTWLAIIHTSGSDNPTGYDQIKDIATPGPRTAVISFKEPYAPWPDLFGGGNVNGYVLKKSAFRNVDELKPNLASSFKGAIAFSGGPWKLASWSESKAVLVRNNHYWGHKSLLDRVTFVPMEDEGDALGALRAGKVAGIHLSEVSSTSLTGQLAGTPRARYVTGPTDYGEALWLNVKKPPLGDPKVRQALGYAVDRQSVVNTIIKLNDPRASVLQCLPPVLPVIGRWCDPTDFAKFTYDPEKSLQLLQSAGWNCKSKPCTKGGEKLSIVDYVLSGVQRSIATGRVIRERALPAGFDIQIKENDPTDLFINKMPRGEYQMADLSLGGVADPSETGTYHCKQIPTEGNNYAGSNTSFWCNSEASRLMEAADREVHPRKRLVLIRKVQDYLAKDVVAIPLYSLVAVTAWRKDMVGGPIGTWNSAFYGTYFNIDRWFRIRRSRAG